MKIKRLKMQNFAEFTNFECEFDSKITRLVGLNGSGKTTVGLTSIWAGLKGISENKNTGQLIGERFRFIGKNKASADIEITLYDEKTNNEIKIKNHITKQANQIIFESEKTLDEKWLKSLFNVAFVSAKNFTQHDSKNQAVLLGIDTQEFDSKLKVLKQEYTFINRDIKAFGTLEEVEQVEEESISELLQQKKDLDNFNKDQSERKNEIEKTKTQITEIENQISQLQETLVSEEAALNKLTPPELEKSTDKIVDKINNVEINNKKANKYKTYIDQKTNKEKKEKELQENKEEQQRIVDERLKYICQFNFGIDGLATSEDGELLLNNKPIRDPYFSKGELELIVAKLHMSIDPQLKIRFIDDFELLDENNQEKIIKELTANDFQIITAEVTEKETNKNTILLRECKKVESLI